MLINAVQQQSGIFSRVLNCRERLFIQTVTDCNVFVSSGYFGGAGGGVEKLDFDFMYKCIWSVMNQVTQTLHRLSPVLYKILTTSGMLILGFAPF